MSTAGPRRAARKAATARREPRPEVPDADATPRGRGISRGLTRDKIVEATKKIVAENGVRSFRILDLAQALDVQPSAIYNHFENREDVLAALSTSISRKVITATEPRPNDTPSAKMEHYIRRSAAVMHADPLMARLQLDDIAMGGMVSRGESRSIMVYGRQRAEKILADGVASGEFRDVSLDILRVLMMGCVSSAVVWQDYEGVKPKMRLRELQDWLVDLVFRFLKP